MKKLQDLHYRTIQIVLSAVAIYLVSLTVMSANRIQYLNEIDDEIINEHLVLARDDIIITKIDEIIDEKIAQNQIIVAEIKKGISRSYIDSEDKFKSDINSIIKYGYRSCNNELSNIIKTELSKCPNKSILVRQNNKISILACDFPIRISPISFNHDSTTKVEELGIRTLILDNTSVDNAKNMISFNNKGKLVDIDYVLKSFANLTENFNSDRIVSFVPSYINWKRGIYGNLILLPSSMHNNKAIQIIVVSRFDIYRELNRDPIIMKFVSHMRDFNKVSIDIPERGKLYYYMILLGNVIILSFIGFALILNKDMGIVKNFYDDLAKSHMDKIDPNQTGVVTDVGNNTSIMLLSEEDIDREINRRCGNLNRKE